MPLHVGRFDALLREAGDQPDAQRLLFVFAALGVPDSNGGATSSLAPLRWFDKLPADMATFDALCSEAGPTTPAWDIVFVSSLAGKLASPPSAALTAAALQHMVEQIRAGRITTLVPFDRSGQPLFFA